MTENFTRRRCWGSKRRDEKQVKDSKKKEGSRPMTTGGRKTQNGTQRKEVNHPYERQSKTEG